MSVNAMNNNRPAPVGQISGAQPADRATTAKNTAASDKTFKDTLTNVTTGETREQTSEQNVNDNKAGALLTDVILAGTTTAALFVAPPAAGLSAVMLTDRVAKVAQNSMNGAGSPTSNLSGPSNSGANGSMDPNANMERMHAMQRESQIFNMELLDLQENIQNENRKFTTLSNVMRARHDSAKSAIQNVRS